MTRGFTVLRWDGQAERLIAGLRLFLAAGSLMVVWLDPTQPARHWPVAYSAFVIYLVYSGVVFHIARTRSWAWLPIVTQLVDLLWVLPVLHFTEGANTPFFPFFVAFTLNAGVRWGGVGAWAVSVYSLLAYGWLLFQKAPAELDLNNDLMRLGYFLVVGALGGYLAEYRRRREAELSMLQSISEGIASKYEAVDAIAALIDIVNRAGLADVVVGVLRQPGDGSLVMVRGVSDVTRLSDEEARPFYEAAAAPPMTKAARTVALTDAAAVILRYADADRGVAYPIRSGPDLVGAIFCLLRVDRPLGRSSDHYLNLLLRYLIPQIETLYVLERARHVHVLEERRRIARDLHDSFIQVLAGLGLRLDALCAPPAGARGVDALVKDLTAMRETISRELRRVRAYLAEMREPLDEVGRLDELVEDVAATFTSRTGIPVDTIVDAEATDRSGRIVTEVAPLLREALTNVEKHARASRVSVSASLQRGQLTLVVRDNGLGIPEAASQWADRAPGGHGHGIPSMRERTRLLGGSLAFERPSAGGTLVTVSIPISPAI
jgi:signal transduction histidine kinase